MLIVNVVVKLHSCSRVLRSLRIFSTLTLFNHWFVLLGLSEDLGLARDKDDGEFVGESFTGAGDLVISMLSAISTVVVVCLIRLQ
jgi:hypothetical protein